MSDNPSPPVDRAAALAEAERAIREQVQAAELAARVRPHHPHHHVIERPERLARMLLLPAAQTGAALAAHVALRIVQIAGQDEQLVVVEVPRSDDEDRSAHAELDRRTEALVAVGAEPMRASEAVAQIAAEYGDERHGQRIELVDGAYAVPQVPSDQAELSSHEWHQIGMQVWRTLLLRYGGPTPAELAARFADYAGVRVHWQVVPGAPDAAPTPPASIFPSRQPVRIPNGPVVQAACYLELWLTVEHDQEALRRRITQLAGKGKHARHRLLPGAHAFAATRSVTGFLVPNEHVQLWPRQLVEEGLGPGRRRPLPPTAGSSRQQGLR